MSACKFVRKNNTSYEYGHIVIHNNGTKNERREYVVQGHAESYEEAVGFNQMALSGAPRGRPNIEPAFWSF